MFAVKSKPLKHIRILFSTDKFLAAFSRPLALPLSLALNENKFHLILFARRKTKQTNKIRLASYSIEVASDDDEKALERWGELNKTWPENENGHDATGYIIFV